MPTAMNNFIKVSSIFAATILFLLVVGVTLDFDRSRSYRASEPLSSISLGFSEDKSNLFISTGYRGANGRFVRHGEMITLELISYSIVDERNYLDGNELVGDGFGPMIKLDYDLSDDRSMLTAFTYFKSLTGESVKHGQEISIETSTHSIIMVNLYRDGNLVERVSVRSTSREILSE